MSSRQKAPTFGAMGNLHEQPMTAIGSRDITTTVQTASS
nr:hypothetical protein [Kibdelosporangium sp. MJ126-NF4]CTQ99069.1 hypothetical protein [Kibdelosporangium sp. MJ126-NF4]